MQIEIQSTHFTVDDTLIKLTTEKLSKLEKLYDRIEMCSVVLKKEKNDKKKRFFVEVRLAVPKEDLFAKEQAESFALALDGVFNELKKQIIKHKVMLREPKGFHEKISTE